MHDNKQILGYWDKEDVESMYDKHLLNAEIKLIEANIGFGSKILDAGCGEGEGTLVYASIDGVVVRAVDFSDTRLRMAEQRLAGRDNVRFDKVDFLKGYSLDDDYDVIVSQRFLINLMEWDLQKKVLLDLMGMLKKGGRLLMLEGSKHGVKKLNDFRALYGLQPIPVKWHNNFFDDDVLIDFMSQSGFSLVKTEGLGGYFVLTRGIRPIFQTELNWDCDFNEISASKGCTDLLGIEGSRCSRLKLWIFEK